jgi:hypothetical protein
MRPGAIGVTWTDAVGAIAAIVTPLAVIVVGYFLNRQLKRVEDQQWRSQQLIKERLGYYREIAEPLNDLMCYFSFIGSWKDHSPPAIVAKKRALDRTFHTLSPFFGAESVHAYNRFMDECFDTYRGWGADPRLKTGFARRKLASATWRPEWEAMFTYDENRTVPREVLEQIKQCYNEVLARLVSDIQVADVRTDYASARVVLNA